MASTWRVLPLASTSAETPRVLVKSSFSVRTGYSIYVTDLTYIWSETLDRRQIIRRGLDDDTSIDPSEDVSQLKILLDKLQAAVGGANGTCVELLPGNGDRQMVLRLTALLPIPLRPLIWLVYLGPSAQESLTDYLVLPLLGSLVVLKDEVSSLLGQMKNKDQVIGKLVDKLESSGMDIGSVFPSAAGLNKRKGSGWERAGKLVNGLERFDEAGWRRDMAAHSWTSKSGDDVIEAIFGGIEHDGVLNQHFAVPRTTLDKWWEKLSASAGVTVRGPEDASTNGGKRASKSQTPRKDSDDDFETQKTPPHLKRSTRRQTARRISPAKESSPTRPSEKSIATDDDETTDVDNLDASSQRPAPKKTISPAKQLQKRVVTDSLSDESASLSKPLQLSSEPKSSGAKGGQNAGSEKPDVVQDPSLVAPNSNQEDDSGSETASEGDEQPAPAKIRSPVPAAAKKSPPSSHQPPQPTKRAPAAKRTTESSTVEEVSAPEPPPTKQKPRLGIIGGKKKPSTADDPASSKALTTPPPKPKARLGTIGSSKKTPALAKSRTPSPSAKSTPGPKLGHIGGKDKTQTENATKAQPPKRERKPSSPLPAPPKTRTPTPEEAEEDKANRKREELKKMLEARSKAPAKKKRKF